VSQSDAAHEREKLNLLTKLLVLNFSKDKINVIIFFCVTFQCLAERHLCMSDQSLDGPATNRYNIIFRILFFASAMLLLEGT